MGMCHPLIFLILSFLFHRYMYKEQLLCSEYASQILHSRHMGGIHRQVTQYRFKWTNLGFQRLMGMCHPLIFLMVSFLFHRYMYKEQPLCSDYASQFFYSRSRGYIQRLVPYFRLKCTLLGFQMFMGMCHPLIFLTLSILLYSSMYKEQPLCSEYASQILYSRLRGVYT